METYWRSRGIAPRILDLSTRWEWMVSFTPRPLYSHGKAPSTHWIGSWVSPRAVLDVVVRRRIPNPHRKSNPRTPIVQPVAPPPPKKTMGSIMTICYWKRTLVHWDSTVSVYFFVHQWKLTCTYIVTQYSIFITGWGPVTTLWSCLHGSVPLLYTYYTAKQLLPDPRTLTHCLDSHNSTTPHLDLHI
jgi:hypothetical protein